MCQKKGRIGAPGLLKRLHVSSRVFQKMLKNLREPMKHTAVYKEIDTTALVTDFTTYVQELYQFETGNKHVSEIFTLDSNINTIINKYGAHFHKDFQMETVLFFASKVFNILLYETKVAVYNAFHQTRYGFLVNRINRVWAGAEKLDKEITKVYLNAIHLTEGDPKVNEFYILVDNCVDEICELFKKHNVEFIDTGVYSENVTPYSIDDIKWLIIQKLGLDKGNKLNLDQPFTCHGFITVQTAE